MATDVSDAAPVSLNFAKGDGRFFPSLPVAGAGPLLISLALDVSSEDVIL